MKFKDFTRWCNDRACDGYWSSRIANICIEIGNQISSQPFWKREMLWLDCVSKTNIVEAIIKPLDIMRMGDTILEQAAKIVDESMVNFKYVLDESGNPLSECNIEKWAEWMARNDRVVARDEIRILSDEIIISTVFLGIDYSFGIGEPILYETMIFGGKHNDYQVRYHTREEALSGHKIAVNLVMDG